MLSGGEIDRLGVFTALAWHLRQRDSRRALELADAAEALLVDGAPTEAGLRERLYLVRVEVAALRGEFDVATGFLNKALSGFKRLDDAIGIGDAHCAAALLARCEGGLTAERDGWAAALASYEQADDEVRRAIAEAWLVIAEIPLRQNRRDDAQKDLTQQALPNESRAVAALRWAGDGLMSEGTRDPVRSAQSWTRAYDNAKDCGQVYVAIYSALLAAKAFRRLGDPDGATGWCERAFEMARPTGWPHLLGACHMLSGSLLYDLKEMERSRDALLEALPISGPNRALCHLFLARTLLALNRPEEALATIDDVEHRQRGSLGDPLHECALLIERARALAGVSRFAEATQQIEIARAMAERARISTYDVLFLEVLASFYESGQLTPPGGETPESATHRCLQEALATGEARPGWRPTTELLKKLAKGSVAIGDLTAGVAYYQRALEVAEQDMVRRMNDRVAAIQVQEDLQRARREAEFHIHQRRAATEGRRADELQAALDAMRAAQATLAERTQEFERLSLLDPLTGIANRRHLEQRASSEMAVVTRKRTTLGVLTFDIDRFKGINDAHGHDFGDKVICEIAEAARGQLRPSDFIARVGGEEFTILLPETGLEEAEITANRVRTAISGRPVIFGGTELKVTASFGVTVVTATESSLDHALKRADIALYAAKRGGRNLVCVETPPISRKRS